MQPVTFEKQTMVLGKPKNWDPEVMGGPCDGLPVHHDGKRWTSCWKPTEEELKLLNEGGSVWLDVCSGETPQPAVSLYAAEEMYEGGDGP